MNVFNMLISTVGKAGKQHAKHLDLKKKQSVKSVPSVKQTTLA